jgi:hypothetical protein
MEDEPRIIQFRPRTGEKRRQPPGEQGSPPESRPSRQPPGAQSGQPSGSQGGLPQRPRRSLFGEGVYDDDDDVTDLDIEAFIQQLQEEFDKPRPRGRPPKPKGGAKVIPLRTQKQPKPEQDSNGADDQ